MHDDTDNPGTATLLRRSLWLSLAVLLAVTGAERLWLASQPGAIADDGILFLWRARDVDVPAVPATERAVLHPGYPALVGWVKRNVVGGAEDDLAGWIQAGRGVALAASLATVVGVWCFALLLFGDGWSALAGALLLGVGRKFAALGAEVLSDSTSLALQVWALVALVWTVRLLARSDRRARVGALLTGLLGGCAFWVRPEGLVVIFLALTVLVAHRISGRSQNWRRTLGMLGLVLLGGFAVVLPYVLQHGSLTNKWELSEFLGSIQIPTSGGVAFLGAVYAIEAPAAVRLLGRFFEAQHPVPASLTCAYVGMWLLGRFRRFRAVGNLLPAARWAPAAVIVSVWVWVPPPVVMRYLQTGAMSHRYLMLPACVSAGLAGAALVGLCRAGADAIRRTRRPKLARAVLPVALACLGGPMLAHAARPLQLSDLHVKQAGQWLREQCRSQLLTDSPMLLFFSQNHRGVLIPEAFLQTDRPDPERTLETSLTQHPHIRWLGVTGSVSDPWSIPCADVFRRAGFEHRRSFPQLREGGKPPKRAMHLFGRAPPDP
jgi:hypothetical protein